MACLTNRAAISPTDCSVAAVHGSKSVHDLRHALLSLAVKHVLAQVELGASVVDRRATALTDDPGERPNIVEAAHYPRPEIGLPSIGA